ncbi:MAG: M12 family metallopeptidase [Bacteroides sp.]|uniref:M12 family metallopeptidase n=2 Tax=Bacteroides sp. TaxID=29523 RepID=UPI002FC7BC87
MKYLYFLIIVGIFTSCSKDIEIESIKQSNILIEQERILSTGDTLVTFSSGVQVVKKNGEYILNEDIILTSEELRLLRNPHTRGSYFTGHRLWNNQTVFYSISPDFFKKEILYQAFEYISNRTNLRFCERSTQGDYILFRNSKENSSYVGRKGGEQPLNLHNQTLGVTVHEICHALGMIHEHSRTDRDEYIVIHYDNIYENKRHNFNIEYGTYSSGSFDFSSIMLYPSMVTDTKFSIDTSKPVMTKKDGSIFVAQREKLSDGDIQALNRIYPIDKYKITGEQYISPQTTASYTLTDNPQKASIKWEIIPSTGAVITSGQGTNSINISFNENGSFGIFATITFMDSYPYYSRKTQSLSVNVSRFPMVSDIELFKYLQRSGEYTLKAVVVNGQNATTQWYCSGNAVLYNIPYPDDATFIDNPQLFKAIDFYSTGSYDITTTASNTSGIGNIFTRSFYITDTKTTSFPLLISPNPMSAGVTPIIEIKNSKDMQKTAISSDNKIEVVIYSKGEKIYNKTTYEKKMKLPLSDLKKGKYNIVVTDEKKSYTTILEVI